MAHLQPRHLCTRSADPHTYIVPPPPQLQGLQAWAHSFWEEPSAKDDGAAADEPEAVEPATNDLPGTDAEEGETAVAGDVAQFAKSAIVELDDDVFAAEPRLDVVYAD